MANFEQMDETFLSEDQKKELKQQQKDEKKQIKKEKERKREQKLTKVLTVLGVLMFLGYGLWSLGIGIYGLFMAPKMELNEIANGIEKYAIYEGNPAYVTECYGGMKHSINLIPVGTEYFYLVWSEDGTTAISVRAGKHWAEGKVGDDIVAGSVHIRGQARKMDYEVKNRLMEVMSYANEGGANFSLQSDYYLDLTCTRMNVFHIIVGLGIIVLICFAIWATNDNKRQMESGNPVGRYKTVLPKWLVTVNGILLLGILILTIYVLTFG